MNSLQKAIMKGAMGAVMDEMVSNVMGSLEDDPTREVALEAMVERAISEMRRRRGPQETAGFLMVVADRIPVMED